MTTLEFEDIELITLGVKCKKCGRTWGIHIEGLKNFEEIPDRRLHCTYCRIKEEVKKEILLEK